MDRTGFIRLLLLADRISAWLLLLLMVAFFVTGFVMLGWPGTGLMDSQLALYLHIVLTPPLLLFFILHAGIRIFLSIRRYTSGQGRA
jgi:cytochrome b subunit of formate dehydrogenase